MVCLQIWRLALCGDQRIDLPEELIGWFLYGLGFCRGYFRADYSIALISEATIAKCLFVFITAAMSFWWFFRLLACSLLKSSFVDVFMTFSALILQECRMISSAECVSYY